LSKLTAAWAALSGAAVALASLVGCDAARVAQLQVGVSTEADVRRVLGTPNAEHAQPDGSRVLEFTRQPEGQENWFATLGGDGRLRSIEQALRPANLATIAAGMTQAEVRRRLGAPARTQRFVLKGEDVWDWRYADGAQALMFSVTFDAGGRVRSTASVPDPREAHGGPSGR
jgi:outer membrane protein assembly factor BamE (lipoprotein component of BamABCDE complex)